MHAEVATTEQLPQFDFPLDHNDPMAFVEFTTMLLSHVESPYDIAYASVAFLREEVVDYVDLHANELSILGAVWSDTLRRVVSGHPIADFAFEVLMLPLFFRRWGWQLERSENWQGLYDNISERMDRLPPNTEYFVTFGIVLFFIDALFTQENEAFDNLIGRYAKRLPHAQYTDALLAIGMTLGRNGWDANFQ